MRASRELRNALNEVYRRLPHDEELAAAAERVADLLDAEHDRLASVPAAVAAADGREEGHLDGVMQERARAAEMWRALAEYARLPADARHVFDR